MKIYSAAFSPNAMRVRAVAYELDVDFELVEVDLRSGDNRTPEYLALNPNAKVPVLDDDGFVLWESRAIMAYLAGRKPEHGLYPDDPKLRAIVDQWLYWQAIHLGPAMQKLSFERVLKATFGMGEPDDAAVGEALKDIGQFLPVLDSGLAGKDWVTGPLTIADFAVASTFHLRKPAGISLNGMRNVEAWIDRMDARPSWQKAVQPMLGMMGD